ncbi:hypothetical protein OROMI_004377 [Orobanche minor]
MGRTWVAEVVLYRKQQFQKCSRMCKIQVYIKKDWMFRFEPLFEEEKCYSISNFAIAENTDTLPLLPSKYKISFYKGTIVTRIEPFDNNVNDFILEPFNWLLDSTRQYHEHEAVGADIVPVMSAAGRKIRRTVVIEDDESNQLDCTFGTTGLHGGMSMPKNVNQWVK